MGFTSGGLLGHDIAKSRSISTICYLKHVSSIFANILKDIGPILAQKTNLIRRFSHSLDIKFLPSISHASTVSMTMLGPFSSSTIRIFLRRLILIGLVVVTHIPLGLPTISAQDGAQTLKKFELFTQCETINLVVEGLNEDASKIGLTVRRITIAAESRLRSARLFSEERMRQYLYVNVNRVGNAHSIDLEFNKKVFDPRSKHSAYATTWSIGGTGTHGQSSSFVISHVSEYIDTFIVEYFKANEPSCSDQ